MALNIPVLESEALIAAQKTINAQSNRFPLFDFFPREQYRGEKLKIRVKIVDSEVGRFTTADGPAHLVKPGTLTTVEVEPLYHRPMVKWTSSDLSLFTMFDEVQQTAGPDAEALESRVSRKMTETLDDASLSARETMHDMLAGALLGTNTYDVDGLSITVTYGHPTLTDPGTDWDDAAATIVADIYATQDEFIQQSDGVPADTVFYNPRAWSRYFVGNTDFRTFIIADPGLARSFGIKGAQPEILADNEGVFADPIFGLRWVPIAGPHIKAGTSEQRWPVDQFIFASLGQDAKRVLEHSMSKDLYNPTPDFRWETFDQDEPKGTFSRYSDNGAAVVLIPGRVQILDVEA